MVREESYLKGVALFSLSLSDVKMSSVNFCNEDEIPK